MSPITASSRIIRNVQPHVTQSVNIANETLQLFCLSGTKQKGIKQLQTKVSTQSAILSSHKVLLQRPTSTFTGSGNGPRGTRRLFKKTTQSCFFMEPSEKVEWKNMIEILLIEWRCVKVTAPTQCRAQNECSLSAGSLRRNFLDNSLTCRATTLKEPGKRRWTLAGYGDGVM